MSVKPLEILIIDDAPFIVERVSLMITDYLKDVSVRTAHTGEEGLLLFEAVIPDILILDINLPGINGIELLRKIKRDTQYPTAIIMLTNNTIHDYKDACLKLGADYFLDKSRDFLMITTIIEKLVQQKMLD